MKPVYISLTLILFLLFSYYFQQLAPEILMIIKNLGRLAPFIFIIFYCVASILFLPSLFLTLAGGALFGPLQGVILNLIGATLGASCAFCISRYLMKDHFRENSGEKLNKLIKGVEAKGWRFVAVLRLIPIIPSNLVNYGLGITKIKFSHFALATLVFLTPCEIAYTLCGYFGMNILINTNSFHNYISLIIILVTGIIFSVYKWFKIKQLN